tara:strand:+ start:871 stop:1176 length:306 start_codon:yes stop_codon:yes gene_type:complete
VTGEDLTEVKVALGIHSTRLDTVNKEIATNQSTLSALHRRLDSIEQSVADKPELQDFKKMLDAANNELVVNIVKKIFVTFITVVTAGGASLIGIKIWGSGD